MRKFFAHVLDNISGWKVEKETETGGVEICGIYWIEPPRPRMRMVLIFGDRESQPKPSFVMIASWAVDR